MKKKTVEEVGEKMRKPKLGTGARFKQLKGKLAAKGAKNPGALAAFIGRKKYGASKFAKLSSAGKKREPEKGETKKHEKSESKAFEKKEKDRKYRSPFSNLGKDEGIKPQAMRFGAQKKQGVRVSGKQLLQKAMGKMSRKEK